MDQGGNGVSSVNVDTQLARIIEAARLEAQKEVDELLQDKLGRLWTARLNASNRSSKEDRDAVEHVLAARMTQLQEARQVLIDQVCKPVFTACDRLMEQVGPLLARKEENRKRLEQVSEGLQARRAAMVQGDAGWHGLKAREAAMASTMEEATRAAMAQYARRCDKIERELVVARKKALISRF
jgi:hypothetical protein